MKNVKLFLLAVVVAAGLWLPAAAKENFVYFGTFGTKAGQGIYVSRWDADTGKLSAPELAAAAANPSFLAVTTDGRFLYAATRPEGGSNAPSGGVQAFAVAARSGKLTALNQVSSGGSGPCQVSVDAAGRRVFVANYAGGSVKSFSVNPDGSLTDSTFIQHSGRSVNTNRQSSPHAHWISAAPGGDYALACDLGTDQVLIYRLNPTNATLTPSVPAAASVPPGAGARHLAFSPDGKSAYVINELTCSVSAFAWAAKRGTLAIRETVSLLPPGVALTNAFTAAAIAVRPDGRFVYGTVRGHDSVAVLAVEAVTGKLSLVQNISCGGQGPRSMSVDPTGRWLIVANQKSQTATVFSIHAVTGQLTATGQVLPIGSPGDVKFLPQF